MDPAVTLGVRAAAAVTAVLLAAPSPAATSIPPGPVIGRTFNTTGAKIATYHGYVAWSDESGGGDSRRFVLMLRHRGVTHRLPVRARPTRPFDVDLGRDQRGHLTAVYSRCRDASSQLRCDLYRYDVAARHESRIPHVNSPADEKLPAIAGRYLAFARGTSVHSVRLLVTDLRTGRTTRIKGGTRSIEAGLRGDAPYTRGTGPTTIDMLGRMVVFGWQTVPRRCPEDGSDNSGSVVTPTRGPGSLIADEAWVDDLSGHHRRVYAACLQGYRGPSLTGRRIGYYADATGTVYSQSLDHPQDVRKAQIGRAPGRPVNPFALDGDRIYYGVSVLSGRSRIHELAPAFSPLRP